MEQSFGVMSDQLTGYGDTGAPLTAIFWSAKEGFIARLMTCHLVRRIVALRGFLPFFDRLPEEERTVSAMTNNTRLIDRKATLLIEGQETTFQANAARK